MARPTKRPEKDKQPEGRASDRPSRASGELALDPKKEEAVMKLRDHIAKDTFVPQVDAFRKEYGLPEPFDLLQVVFETHPEVAVRVEALEKMDSKVDRQADSTKQVFKTRVKLLQMTAREPELKKLAVRIARARGY